MINRRLRAKRSLAQRVTFSILGAILLGAIGSGVWEVIAKPGLSRTGRFFLSLFTLGSTKLRDASYASAALDPTPLPALLVLFVIVPMFPAFLLGVFLRAKVEQGRRYREIRGARKNIEDFENLIDKIRKVRGTDFPKQVPESIDSSKEPTVVELKHPLVSKKSEPKKKGNRRGWLELLAIGLFLIAGQLFVTTISQSILIYRVFNANLVVCSPFLTEIEEEGLRARFASVRSKAEYQIIEQELRMIAAKNGVRLKDIELW